MSDVAIAQRGAERAAEKVRLEVELLEDGRNRNEKRKRRDEVSREREAILERRPALVKTGNERGLEKLDAELSAQTVRGRAAQEILDAAEAAYSLAEGRLSEIRREEARESAIAAYAERSIAIDALKSKAKADLRVLGADLFDLMTETDKANAQAKYLKGIGHNALQFIEMWPTVSKMIEEILNEDRNALRVGIDLVVKPLPRPTV